ncbi:biotin--[acetyl-CoA-carboxylase] ligase [Liquorilactobacillus sicerae]|uniref:biotin--[acetyl-CoA-carboxylase] ligase n=1 Tax=Liquorilactobacillus sicerae TaxID=1416943 RepID=UPI002481708A|nr:biotin--[acetyl-CoA-carboxylase] ligase [Liquorilactobacillus sicerae]
MEYSNEILKMLSNTDQPLSGEKIAQSLKISRAAVWKIIQKLQANGYQIESQHRLGYIYHDNGKLNQYVIKKDLTVELSQQLDFEIHQTIDSTNTRAKQLSLQKHLHPLVILSDQQTAGYGRYGRNYSSPSGNIYLSLLLPNPSQRLNPGLLTTATALAVSLAIEKKLLAQPQIKWVNDVLLDQKKIVGILTEAITNIETRSIDQVIIGIGINYLTRLDQLPPEIKSRAGSLRKFALAAQVTRNHFIAAVLNQFFQIYQTYQTGDFLPAYRQRCYLLGKEVTIQQGQQKMVGLVSDIDQQGCLVLSNGQHISSGEVTKIRLK